MLPAEILAHLKKVDTKGVVLRMMGITDVTVVLNLVNQRPDVIGLERSRIHAVTLAHRERSRCVLNLCPLG